jgi:hypothetical protein
MMNKKDPLHRTPDAERVLFSLLVKTSNGFSNDQVIGAAVNLIINALRQQNATHKGAQDAVDRVHAILRTVLASHYDALGKRRNVFPFHQMLEVPHMDDRGK